MTLRRRTYTLPEETLRQFEEAVAPRQRSSTIDTLLRAWLEQRQREQLRREIIEGCARWPMCTLPSKESTTHSLKMATRLTQF